MNMARQGLPNFLMIGAPRTGSTALYDALRRHPDFFLAQGKETHFFSAGGDRSLEAQRALHIPYREMYAAAEYADCFAGAEAFSLRGEIDPSILRCAAYAIPRLREFFETPPKFVVVLRQPVERAYSHYLLHRRYGYEPHPFEQYADVVTPHTPLEIIALDRYFGHSYYFETLRAFFAAFGREAFLVLLYDDLVADAPAFLRQILVFLNADTGLVPDMVPETNAGMVGQTLKARLHGRGHPLRRLARVCLPRSAQTAARRLLRWNSKDARGFSKPALAPETRARLMPRYREDILSTQDLIQRDLTHWLNSQ